MRSASLCKGYGGLDLGLAAVLDVEEVWCAEYDPHASKVIAHHWPDLPNLGDITAIDWATCEPVEVITAGYPCQPFSHAGRRKGTDDVRHLWPHIAEAVRVLRPRLVVLENVAGHLSLGFGTVLGDLAALGYDVRWRCLRASDIGAPHRRERVFIVATDTRSAGTGWDAGAVPRAAEEGGRPRADIHAPVDARADLAPHADQPGPQGPKSAGRRHLPPGGDRPPAANADGLAWSPGGAQQRRPRAMEEPGEVERAERLHRVAWGAYEPAIRRWEHVTGRCSPDPTDNRGRLNPPFVEWMMGLAAGHVTDVGLPRTAELKILGNGVVWQQAAAALAPLLEQMEAAA